MRPYISVVTTLYKSATHVNDFAARASAAASRLSDSYEIIFVNDGPTDNAPALVKSLIKENSKIKLIELSRNFGHHKAIMAGLEHATGQYVFLIDSDLEEAPEDLLDFHSKITSTPDLDAVYGFQINRKGAFFERFSGWIFYTLLTWLSDIPVPRNLTTTRLMSRRYVDGLMQFPEREFMFGGLVELAGFNTQGVAINKLDKGTSSYTLKKKIDLFVNAITSMSSKPLWLIFKSGLAITAIAFAIFFIFLVRYFLGGPSVVGWPSLILSIWMIGGITISFLGIIAIYLSKIFSEVKERPRYIIKSLSNMDK